jgi:multimeric flavodoxin WrbA
VTSVLGIVGSPRAGGNTHVLVREVLAGAEEAGAATETLLLGELDIAECDGCHACWEHKPCVKDDDMNRLYPAIAAGDALVLGTPVYWYGPTALIKAFLDRFVYFNCPEHRPEVRGKAAAIVVPFEERRRETADLVLEMLTRSLAYLEMNLIGTVIAPGVTRRGEVTDKPDRLREARDLGRKLAAARP